MIFFHSYIHYSRNVLLWWDDTRTIAMENLPFREDLKPVMSSGSKGSKNLPTAYWNWRAKENHWMVFLDLKPWKSSINHPGKPTGWRFLGQSTGWFSWMINGFHEMVHEMINGYNKWMEHHLNMVIFSINQQKSAYRSPLLNPSSWNLHTHLPLSKPGENRQKPWLLHVLTTENVGFHKIPVRSCILIVTPKLDAEKCETRMVQWCLYHPL